MCVKDKEVGGRYDIPAGSIVFVSLNPMNKNPERWKNPDEFEPERFENLPELKMVSNSSSFNVSVYTHSNLC